MDKYCLADKVKFVPVLHSTSSPSNYYDGEDANMDFIGVVNCRRTSCSIWQSELFQIVFCSGGWNCSKNMLIEVMIISCLGRE
jgi:hypothetical protein